MVRVLITNAWSWYNKGDAAIVITMADALRKYISDIEISVLSFTADVDSAKYEKYGIKVLGGLRFRFLKKNRRTRIMRVMDYVSQTFRWSLWAILFRLLRKDVKSLKGEEEKILTEFLMADIIVACGGEVLYDNGFGFLFNLYEIFFGKIFLGKPVIIYSQSIGPFKRGFWAALTGLILNTSDLITLREEISAQYLREMGVRRPPVFVTSDSAFLLHPVSRKEARELLSKLRIDLNGGPLIGMTLRPWFLSDEEDPKYKFQRYITIIANIVDYLAERLCATVIFMPQVIIPEEDDRLVANKVFQLVKRKDQFKILTEDYSPEELKGIIGEMDLFLGTRMHSNIFSISMNVPTMAIGYRHKTRGIMKMLGQEEYVCEIGRLKFEDVVHKIENIWIHREGVRGYLKEKVKKLEDLALFNAKLVKDILDAKNRGL